MAKEKYFKCLICRQPMKLIEKSDPYHKGVKTNVIVCSRDKCVNEIKLDTPEKTIKYFIDNGGRVEGGS